MPLRFESKKQLYDFLAGRGLKSKTNKYHNQRIEFEGWTFDSKAELRRYKELLILKQAGKIKYILCQVPFRLPGKIKYVVDFQIFWSDGKVTYEDVKGKMNQVSHNKIKQVEALYPIKIEIVK